MRPAVDEKTNNLKQRGIWTNRMALHLLLMFVLARAASCVSDLDSQRACQQFTADKEIKNLIVEKQKLITPCPCVKQKIELDYSFEKNGDCFRQRMFEDGVKQMCCYSSDGNIQIGAPRGGYMLFETLWKNMSDVKRNCCREEITCDMFYNFNPSDDCSAYLPPVIVTSSGDPVIQTIDGNEFDFNGHGEYVFLKTSELEIQVRLGYVIPGNTDATLFEAFSLFDSNTNDTLEVQLKRSEQDIHVYKNGIVSCNASANGPAIPCKMLPPRLSDCLVLAGGGKAVIVGCGTKTFASQIVFTAGKMMSVSITPNQYAKNLTISGLAGHQKDGSFVFRNGSEVASNSSASILYDYGESWSLGNERESHFNYASTHGNYTFYNRHHTRPRFLEDLVGNLTSLFKGYSEANISLFSDTCRNYWDNTPNEQCLLTIARSKNYNLGLEVMSTVNDTHKRWELLHNKVPAFLPTMPDNITAFYKEDFTINLKDYVSDDEDTDQLNYDISTDILDDEFTLDGGVFTWNVGTSLRYIDTSFTFYVIDKLKLSGSHDVTINYCGCDNSSECNFDTQNVNSSGNVIKAGCQCPDYFTGLYCETGLDPCENKSHVKCFHNNCSKDFDRSLESWPCAPCPKGWRSVMTLKEQKCNNIDECDPGYSGEDKCEQHCNDTDGFFNCSCDTGFTLNSNKYSCDDIDECAKSGLCGEHEICINGEGSYVCDCAPGYLRKNLNDTCEKISESLTPYVGSIAIIIAIKDSEVDEINKTIDNPNNRNTFKNRLDAVFKNATGYKSVEVTRIIIIKTSTHRKKREEDQTYRLDVQYIVHWSNKSDDEKVTKALQQSFSNIRNKTDPIKIENLPKPIRFAGVDVHVNNANETGLCDISSKNDCDPESTDCHDNNHKIECKCKLGYTPAIVTTKFCNDKDECKEFDKTGSINERCVHGTCVNTPGSWNCSCPSNRVWQNVGNKSYPVYRCQGDYQYIGEIKLLWIDETAQKGQLKDFLNETIESLFSMKNISFAERSPYMHEVFLSVEYLNATFENSTPGFVHVTSSYILHLGESVTSGWVEKFQSKVFTYSNSFTSKDGTKVNIIGSSIFNESGKNLCNIPHKTKCDLESTTCNVHNGSYSCTCKSGFHVRIDDIYCKDIDECKDQRVVCESGTCSNTIGSWECLCDETSSFNRTNDTYGVCEDKNECNDTSYICQSGHCHDVIGGWNCTCDPGYYRQELVPNKIYTCTDIDECSTKLLDIACLEASECINTIGSWECLCSDGFTEKVINKTSKTCEVDYQYVASVSFSYFGKITDVSEIKKAIQQKITVMYVEALDDASVWIEILKFTGFPANTRRKRAAPQQHNINAEYVVHTTAEKNTEELNKVEKVYREKHGCASQTVKCDEKIDGGFPIQFAKIQTKNNSAICETNKNNCDRTTTTCVSTNGQLVCNCTTKYPQKKSRTNCTDPCQNSRCHETSTCSHWDNDDGYICGCGKGRKGDYCSEIDTEMQYKKQQTTLIAVMSSLGALVLILAGVIFGVCRWRAAKIKLAEKVAMRPMDTSGFNSFPSNQNMTNSRDDVDSLYSHRLPNVSIPRVQQNGDLYRHQNGQIPTSLYVKPIQLPKPHLRGSQHLLGSMPNLACGDVQFYPPDYRRRSDEYHNRFSGDNGHTLSASYNDLRNVNGRTSPLPDYDRSGSPKPDYRMNSRPSYDVTRPRSPRPDYNRRERFNASWDSGVGNGYSSDSNDFRRTDQRRGYPNKYRHSDTRF